MIFLDLPARACLWGIIQRRLRHGGGQHDAIGVYDRITWNFIRYIAGYRKQMAPRVRQLIAEHAGDAQVVVLRSRRAARRYLASVTAAAGRSAVRLTPAAVVLPVTSGARDDALARSPIPAQVRGRALRLGRPARPAYRSPAPSPGNRPARWRGDRRSRPGGSGSGTNAVPIADLGCGRGTTTRMLAHRLPAARVAAVDLSAALLAAPGSGSRRRWPPVRSGRISAACLWPANSCDLVVAAFCLYHSPSPGR